MYQVWSSVLGQSMTTILPNGNKYESNVFAGGAVIAKNSTAGVGWRTADPVTGSVAYVGATAGEVEEFEPLGQKLHNQDPDPPPDPLPTESRWNSADYPEWMCEKQNAMFLYGNQFNQWPDACQKRYLQDLDTPLKDLFGWGGKKESSSRVSILLRKSLPPTPFGSPDSGSTHAANSMRSFALTSTAKDDDDTNCRPGRPCLPKEEKVNIPIPLIDMTEIPGFVDASVGMTDDKIKLTNEEIEVIRGRILFEIASNDICAEFLEKLAGITLGEKVIASDLINEGVDRVKNTLGFHWAAYPGAGGVATGHKKTSPHANLGEIWFSSKKETMSPYVSVGAIHEIVHVAARANDKDLSEAVKALGIEVILDSGKTMEYPKDENNDKLAFSGYWGQALKNHCGPGTINRQFVPKQ